MWVINVLVFVRVSSASVIGTDVKPFKCDIRWSKCQISHPNSSAPIRSDPWRRGARARQPLCVVCCVCYIVVAIDTTES